jgi:hypothetical protein
VTEKRRTASRPYIYKIKRKYEGQPVRPDPTAHLKENETAIHFTGRDRQAWVSSYEPAVVEKLLKYKHFKLEQLITMEVEGQECVVGVIGRVPIGAIRLGRRRRSDRHELIVSRS